MTPEENLSLLLACQQLSPSLQKRVSDLLSGPLYWPRVIEKARKYDIFPLLYHNLQAFEFAGVPGPVRTDLGQIFAGNALRNELLAQELAGVLRRLGTAGVPVIALKGIALTESLYGDIALRTCADIDVLVPPKHLTEAFNLLVSDGYEPEFSEPPLLNLIFRYGKDCSLVRHDETHAYPLELHCGLIWGGPLERQLLDEIWSDARPIEFRGVTTLAMASDWQFLYLAVHAARHGPPSLKWLLDLDRLCRSQPIDWESVVAKAHRLGWENAVASSLSACAALFDTPLEPSFCATLPRQQPYLEASLRLRLQVATEMVFALRMLRTSMAKVQYLAIRLFIPTPADCRFLRLPPSLFFLHYLLRPIRVACKALGWLILSACRALH
jgi:hypothetical protein